MHRVVGQAKLIHSTSFKSIRVGDHFIMGIEMCHHIVGNFQRIFIFGYFKKALLFENKFPIPAILRKYIPPIKSYLPSLDQTYWHRHVIITHQFYSGYKTVSLLRQ